MRGRLFSYLVVFWLLWLGEILTILSPMPCIGSESGEELATFSLEVDQQALGEVLQQIAKTTSYEITIYYGKKIQGTRRILLALRKGIKICIHIKK